MLVYSLLLITLLLGLYSIILIVKARRVHWSLAVLAVPLAVFIYLYGAWIYVSFYSKYVFGVAFLVAFIVGISRKKLPPRKIAALRMAINTGMSLVLDTMIVLFFTGTSGTPETVELDFPLKKGNYFVLQGGKGLPTNIFHYNAHHAVYAMDIVRLNDGGQRCSKIFSRNNDEYFIFRDTVYSPCDGIVRRAIDDNPDNIPPERKRGPHNLNGVVLESDRCYVFLGHLMQNAVFVKAGDVVKAGTPLGLAGNSGMSIEPHLHIQAHKKSNDGSPWYSQPQLYIHFNGQGYLLFQRIKATLSSNSTADAARPTER